MLGRADDLDSVRAAVEGVGEYKSFFEQGAFGMGGSMGAGQPKSLEDLFYQREMEISKATFTQQFTHAVVFSWVKLKEQVCVSPSTSFTRVQKLTGEIGN
jgi:V-type H+-transporting ATPase subunit d